MTYNGYTNYETWNIALWLSNDEDLYFAAVNFMKIYDGANPYKAFIESMHMNDAATPDDVEYLSDKLNYEELDAVMRDLMD